MDVFSGICSALGGLTPVIAAFCKVTDKAVELAKPKDPLSLRELSLKVTSLEIDLRKVEELIPNLTFEQRREEVLSLTRVVEAERAHLQAALDIAADQPNNRSVEAQALGAAQALAKPVFYALPGRTAGAADRFDPRVALPSFVVAVEGWLAIRAAAKMPMTGNSRRQLASFAERLREIVSQMRASVHCEEVFHDFNRFSCPKPKDKTVRRPGDPEPEPTPECDPTPACNHRLSCTDEMNADTNATGTTTDGVCPGGTTVNAQRNRATRLADYQVDQYDGIAIKWGAMALDPIPLPTRTEVTVSANVLWVDTGVTVQAGQHFRVQASGLWSNTGPPAKGPNGFIGFSHPSSLLPTANFASLIGRVGGVMFPVGEGFDGPSPRAGTLFLSINDLPDTFADNQGTLAVTIVLQ
jgi:hypothetical protein